MNTLTMILLFVTGLTIGLLIGKEYGKKDVIMSIKEVVTSVTSVMPAKKKEEPKQ